MGASYTAEGPATRILIVEDDEAVRAVTTRALERLGYEILPAASGAEALALLAGTRAIGLVLLDLALPGASAREVLRAAARSQPGARVVALTGYSRDVVDEALGRRALDGFIQKPFELATLEAVVQRALAATGRGVSESPQELQ